jgi:phosphatidylserine decarboxylase
MEAITYIDRITGNIEVEKVYSQAALNFLYGPSFLSKLIGTPLMYLLSGVPLFSSFVGYYHQLPSSKKKIAPFIKNFNVDASEFRDPIESFQSFNDFFIRKLKPESRPLAANINVAIIPADGRYLFIPHIQQSEGFVVKGQKFDLESLLNNKQLADEYAEGTMVIARLCPSDYHRFHFPCDCIPEATQFINGWLFSVNPIAVRKNIHIFTQNKRSFCKLKTQAFGDVLFIEIGATTVGSIHSTYTPFQSYLKGDEKGYFSFGASSLILLFPPGSIQLDPELLAHPYKEIKCLMGQSMGHSIYS